MARVAGVILAIAAAVTSVSAQDPLGTTNVTCSGVDYTWVRTRSLACIVHVAHEQSIGQ
jgi:hypothetical protein